MSVRLRLRRMGKKKQPFYRIVAIDSRAARDARYLENLGTYNPIKDPVEISVKEDRVLYWLGQGAIPSDTVRSFFKKKGIMLRWHLMKQGADDAIIEEELKKWEVLQMERQKRLDALEEQQKREGQKKKKDKAEAGKSEEVIAAAKSEVPAVEPQTEEAEEVKAAEPDSTPEAEAIAEPVEDEAEVEAVTISEPEDEKEEANVETAPKAEESGTPGNGEQSADDGDEEKKSES